MEEKRPKGTENILLYEQHNHISEGISHRVELGRYRCITSNPKKSIWKLNKTQWGYVRQTGLYHLVEINEMRIDHALITALIERWRPETNTFLFSFGEATVTLEDVAYIYGLLIEGKLVVGWTHPSVKVVSLCEELLKMSPHPEVDTQGLCIKLKWIEDNFLPSEKKAKSPKEFEICNTRAFLFHLVARQIFMNGSGTRGPAYLLELFRKFKPYAWGPSCLANLYRMLARAITWTADINESREDVAAPDGKDKNKKKATTAHFKTLTGPLQLLQIWAYSCMSIGRCPTPKDSWKKDIKFPLFKTWEARLDGYKALTAIKYVRHQLDNMKSDSFAWMPYATYVKKFTQNVSDVDRRLFMSNTILIHYWIMEYHNSNRVMKQFGLSQVVPPTFQMPLLKVEKVERMSRDYTHIPPKVSSMWDARLDVVLQGQKDASPTHTDEYFKWYIPNTCMCIGHHRREPNSEDERKAKPNVPQQEAPPSQGAGSSNDHVNMFLDALEKSVDRAVRKKRSLETFAGKLHKKIKTFRGAFATTLENFSMENYSSSSSDLDMEQDRTPKRIRKAVRKEPSSKKSVSPKTLMIVETPPPSSLTSPQVSSHELPPIKDVLSPKWAVTNQPKLLGILSTPTHAGIFQAIILSPSQSDIESLVWRIKRLPRTRKVPQKFDGYSHTIHYTKCHFDSQDSELLNGFKDYYKFRKKELDVICTLVDSNVLHDALEEGKWLDTNIIYYWFACLRDMCDTTYLADPSICSMWKEGHRQTEPLAFGLNGTNVMDMKESKTLVFLLHHINHFTLLVGYPDEAVWEFYNSSTSDHYSLTTCKEFVGWLTQKFAVYGWNDPFIWTFKEKIDIPHQDNGNDCGVFACAFAEHCILRKPLKFTQADIPFYRSKIVLEIFKRTWVLNSHRLDLSDLD